MKRKYRISTSIPAGDVNLVFEKTIVSEETFWSRLESQLKELAGEDSEKYQSTLDQIKDILSTGKQVTIGGLCFEISKYKCNNLFLTRS